MVEKIQEALKVIKPSDVYRYVEIDYRNVSCNFHSIWFLGDFLKRQIENYGFIQALIITEYDEVYTLLANREKIEIGMLNSDFSYEVGKVIKIKEYDE
jgi:hypothetical protein